MLFNMLSSFAVEIDSRQNFVFDISIISDLILSSLLTFVNLF